MSVSLVALCCRTADRTPGGVVGAQTLAPLIGKRLGVEPRTIGTPGEPRDQPMADLSTSPGDERNRGAH